MNKEELARVREELAREHGPWQDNVLLGDDLYTVTERVTGDQLRIKSILQAVADVLDKPVDHSRVLDLGAAEGAFAVEFARHGAEVVAVEGRAGNVAKIQFVKKALGLGKLEVVQTDVRELSREAHGEFDVVLCLGLLYHLDGAAGVALASAVGEVCRGVAVFDTHIAFRSNRSTTVNGHTYWGRAVREFDPQASEREQERLSRSAIGNAESVWLTRPSLYNLLLDAGFTSVVELRVPRHEKTSDRVTLLSFKGSPQLLASAPRANEMASARWPERQREAPHSNQTWRGDLKLRLAPLAPGPLKAWVRRRRARLRF